MDRPTVSEPSNFGKPWVLSTDRTRWRIARYCLYFAVFLGFRTQLLHDFPLLLTGDSWNYLGSTTAIARHADFSSEGELGLRDCRTPGYPLFQATFLAFTQLRSDRILLVQAGLGLLTAAMGWGIGRAVRSPWAGEGLTLFLGLNPVYLVYEHAMMSEGLSLFAVVAFAWIALRTMRDGLSAWRGLIMGVLFGFNVLVRINALPFCAILTAGTFFACVVRRQEFGGRKAFVFLMAWTIATSVVIGPWLYRNYQCYQKLTLNMYQNRALFIYKSFHRSFDSKLPEYQSECTALQSSTLSYEWLAKLAARHGTAGSEAVAGELLREQWKRHPREHRKDIYRAAAAFCGQYETIALGNDRAPVRYWFEILVGDVSKVDQLHAMQRSVASRLGFIYSESHGDSFWTKVWQKVGLKYLIMGRTWLSTAFFAAIFWRLMSSVRTSTSDGRGWAIWSVAGAYLATMAFHSFTLTDSDRFSTLYDWAALLVVLLVIGTNRRSTFGSRDSRPGTAIDPPLSSW